MSFQSRGSYLLLLLIISFSLCSCASPTPPSTPAVSVPIPAASSVPSAIKPVPREKSVKDTFSRTYSVDFMFFYPKLHSALQDYASRNMGTSFQIVLLGGKLVIFRGHFKREGDQDRFFTVITAKPVGPKKTLMEVKISPGNSEASSAYLEKAADDLFQIAEKGISP